MQFDGKVRYSDTDQMGVAHHSNYVKWLEDARVAFFEKQGISLQEIENEGFFIPVIAVDVQYKGALRFGEKFRITISSAERTGARFIFHYFILKEGAICAKATTTHCVTTHSMRPVPYKRWPKSLSLNLN